MSPAKSESSAYTPVMSAGTRRWVEAGLARRPRGFLTDIDGTLSAVAPTPDKATLYRGIRPLLRQCLAAFDLVAAISGRPALDARRMIGVSRMTYVGNHGMETLEPGARSPLVTPEARAYQAAIADALHEARQRLDGQVDDLLFENKGATASIHYRLAADPERARAAIRAALDPFAQRHHLRVTEGRMVVEIRPPIDRDKGTSVVTLAREHALASAVYLGDDRTDEDAFRALRELRASGECVGIAVAVGHAEAPATLLDSADIALSSIAEVPRFIRWMLRTLGA
ncbi:MAG TPA: trehalose-phosphatase [Ktedonobacterales bacterium]|nr:trehalose-phosphatase [Ktedonobacterales bacterium]